MSADTNCMDDFDPDSLRMDAALQRILNSVAPITETELVPLSDAGGRILADAAVADIAVPSFASSAMDGYALAHSAVHTGVWKLIGSSLAGHPFVGRVNSGECVRITTGAAMPEGSDTVVMQENVTRDGDQIRIATLPRAGTHVRDPGSNIAPGSTVVTEHTRLGPAELGVLSSVGATQLRVLRKLVVACFSTGDELQPPEASLGPGQIHDSNRYLLMELLRTPCIELIDLGIQPDVPGALRECLQAANRADLVLTTGGVSVGDADHMRDIVSEQGQINLWKIAMKPGRPLTFATLDSGALFFGLPGNPVSGMVTFHQFVLPALDRMLQQATPPVWVQPAVVTDTLSKLPGRVELQRGLLRQRDSGDWEVSSTGAQDSHVLMSMQQANCYIVLEMDSTGAAAGDTVSTLPFVNYLRG